MPGAQDGQGLPVLGHHGDHRRNLFRRSGVDDDVRGAGDGAVEPGHRVAVRLVTGLQYRRHPCPSKCD